MKKIIVTISALIIAGVAMAQNAPKPTADEPGKLVSIEATAPKTTTLTTENMYFKFPVHDFGTIQEGPAAEHEFEFTNTGKEPIIISNVSASCGCTTPSYSKDPVLPGKKGTIKASYNTQGRVDPFTKTITITSNAGIKVLTIKGEVEKAPSGSVPENNSMMKTH
ncbi:MAG: DUF1573 domain-containing protein [Phycisphaerales bacterium]|nr:DUF1573 domain-containing protein [Phycisphaerales bacterium]